MEQSVSRVSRGGAILKIAVAAMIGIAGLTVVGVDSAFAAAGPPAITSMGNGVNSSGTCPATTTGFSGTADGGNQIVLCGTLFGTQALIANTSVTVGGVAATINSITSNSKMYVTVPAATSATALNDVIVKNTALTTSSTSTCSTPACQYTYTWAAPTVAGVGLTAVTATSEVSSVITITAAGTWATGQQVSLAGFTNGITSAAYTILAGGTGSFTISYAGTTTGSGTGIVSPSSAGGVGPTAGTTSVVVRGTNFAGASAISFGGTPATSFTVNSPTQITAIAPAGPVGPVNVQVTNPNSQSVVTPPSDTFSYLATPTVTGVSSTANPAGGPTGGGTQVTISGTSFDNVTGVSFGATPATSYLVNSLTSITAISPSKSAGAVDVTVSTGLGTSVTSANDTFAFDVTLAVANGTASYTNAAGTPVPVTGTSQAASTVTLNAVGVWSAGQHVNLSGFTNGLTAGPYTVLGGGTGSFTVTFAPVLSGSSAGTAVLPSTTAPGSPTAVSQSGSTVTITAVGSWFVGQELYLSGFTNGITTGNYPVATGGTGSFTITFAPAVSSCAPLPAPTQCSVADTILAYQASSFNAATLVTGGGTVNPTVTIKTQPSSGTLSAVGSQLIYIPAQSTPTSYLLGANTQWNITVTTAGTQVGTFTVCQTAPSATCVDGTITYLVSQGGFFVGNQLSASGLAVSVVNDTGGAIAVPASAATGSTFTTVTAPPMAGLPANNSGFAVSGIGGYQAITPIPTGVTLVPGSLKVTGGDALTTGKYTATYCTSALIYVPGTCTANNSGNFHTPGDYIETSLNSASQIAGGTQLSLPSISAQWHVTGSAGATISSFETEFVVVTNVVTIGVLFLDAYPTDLASYLNQGTGAPVPVYTPPSARWSLNVTAGGPTAPVITSANATTFVVGTPGTFTVTASGSPASTFSEVGTLPTGVSLNSSTGVLSGTPAPGTSGSYPFAITAANGTVPNGSQNFTLTVHQAPAITSAISTTFTVGSAGTFTVVATGFPAPTFSETGALPSGVTLNSSTGVLSGTPAAATGGSYPITITATNAVNPDAIQNFTLTVHQGPAITSANSTTFTVGSAGTFTVVATGSPAPTFSETGALPTGVTLNSSTGVLAGTPAAATSGSYPFTITATNAVNPDAIQNFTLTVHQAPAITSATSASFVMGSAGTFTVVATGNPAPTFSETGALPSGVTLNSSTGVLSGTPIIGSNGSYPITITAANTVNPNATQAFTLTVSIALTAPAITSATSTTFTVGAAGTFTVVATGNPAPTFSETGALPSGVTLNSSTGVLSGTPGAGTANTYPITITAANGNTPDATQSFTLTVNQVPAITSANSTTFAVGSAGTFTVVATGSPAPTFSETGALPSGVTLNSSTGVLSGTPAGGTGGSYPITITAANTVTPNATQNFTLTVTAPPTAPVVTSANANTFVVGAAGTFTVTATGYPIPTFSETGPLPSGVTLNSSTGVLSGTPGAGTGGTYAITITATNAVNPAGTQNFTLTVHQAPAITSATSTTFAVGSAGTFTVVATGFPAPTFSETGALPTGVTLNSSTGVLSGTPGVGTGGSYPVTITATNAVSPAGTQNFTLTVHQAPAITSANSTTFTVGSAGTFTVTAIGFPIPTFSEVGALPSGVTLNSSTGVLSGTPGAGTGGSYPVTITATNAVSPDATENFTLTVHQAPAITSANSTTFTVGSAGTFTVTAIGFPIPTFSEVGALPSGVTLNSSTGVLSGTPGAGTGGSYPVTITATNAVSPDAIQNFTLTVPTPPAAPTITMVTTGDRSATVTWSPGPDGGSPIVSYTVSASPGTGSCTILAPVAVCTVNGLTNGTAYTFTVTASNVEGPSQPSASSNPATPSGIAAIPGYWMATSAGAVLTNGTAVSYGSPAGLALTAPIVALVPTPDRHGYWLVGSDGGVFSYGNATFFGSTGGKHLNASIVGMASTPDGKGYWLVAADGGVFAYGNAAFAGSTGGQHLNAPVVGIAGNGAGGYWLVAADGGIFAYGGAMFHGSAGALTLASPVVGIAALANGSGYYLAAADGGVFAYGAAPFLGSASGVSNSAIVGITNGAGGGYILGSATGGVFAYGAGFYGTPSSPTTAPIVAIAS